MQNRQHRLTSAPLAVSDRCRAGERLQAALAGLQELDLLKERQRELVRRALGTEPAPTQTGTEEQRLESTLSALKEQLSHLRKQDVGLKVHLQHLDRQISELKLDVSKASSEQLESDSRSSSGFYELSDAGSCSLSNSCNSMYSDSTSSSQGSLVYCSQPGQIKGSRPENRPRSADETTVQSAGLTPQGPGKRPGRGIKTTAEPALPLSCGRLGLARPRPRPVSTGDLERFVPQQKEPAAPLEQKGVRNADVVDWKYRCDLVSKNSGDVYNYPSPLHAVALQSPLFSLSRRALSVENKYSLLGTALPCPESKPVPLEAGLGCLNKRAELVQLSRADVSCDPGVGPNAVVCEKELACPGEARKDNCVNNGTRGQLEKMLASRRGDRWQGAGLQGEGVAKAKASRWEPAGKGNISALIDQLGGDSKADGSGLHFKPVVKGLITTGSCLGLPMAREAGFCTDLSMAYRAGSSSSLLTAHGADSCLGLPTAQGAGFCTGLVGLSNGSQLTGQDPGSPSANVPPRPGQDRPRGMAGQRVGGPLGDGFVQAWFVAPESRQRVQVWPSGSKAKVTKIKRRVSEAGWCGTQTLDGAGAILGPVAKGSWGDGHGPSGPGDEPGFHPPSCGPGFWCSALCQEPGARPSLCPAGRMASGRRFCWGAPRHRAGRANRARVPCTGRQRGFRARPGGFSDSEQSEYSAECASLFHSTIASGSSADERSDRTADRFGDAESSGSEFGPPAEQAGGGPLLGTLGPAPNQPTTGRSRRTEARICRIKASRALKKKIRKFQPEALKVMTMV
ncbi:dapper homolog 2-like [Pristis pectinata]|uniref:dapper homolog 2-like n=1 Tax=Pristis pectinata TaxID=685728 RepID=UPI00223E70FD|nr:dapper homolog 2-like [Pristis pectinata]